MFSSIPVTVPSACLRMPHELFYMSDNLLTTKYKNLVHVADLEDGGHFAAFEMPEAFSEDVWVAVGKMEAFHKSAKKA